jgi:hypothetical protein
MRIDSSSGKSTCKRLAICSGDQPLTHFRSPRCGLFRPLNGPAWARQFYDHQRMYFALQALLYILTQLCISRQLRWLWSFSEPFCLPLRDRSTILEAPTTCIDARSAKSRVECQSPFRCSWLSPFFRLARATRASALPTRLPRNARRHAFAHRSGLR